MRRRGSSRRAESDPLVCGLRRRGPINARPPPIFPKESAVKTRTQSRVHIRWAIKRDLPEVLAIEQASFTLPWQEEDFLKALRQRNTIGNVAELCLPKGHPNYTGEWPIVGYMVYELGPCLTILNLAVHPAHRRCGVGRQMVAKLQSKLSPRKNRIRVDVSEASLPGHLFFRAVGFEAVRVLRNHYDTGEDAYRFEYRYRGDDVDEGGEG